MTGKSILEALSFVDEKYIEEAENGYFPSGVKTFGRAMLPLAACFCLVVTGLFLMDRIGLTQETASAVQNVQEELSDTVQEEKAESAICGENDIAPEMEAPIWIEDCEVPSVVLRIVQWTEDGFTATVEKTVDTDIYPVGAVLNVEIMANICIETYSDELVTVERRIPTEADFPAGTLIRVQFHSKPEEENTIFIETITREGE